MAETAAPAERVAASRLVPAARRRPATGIAGSLTGSGAPGAVVVRDPDTGKTEAACPLLEQLRAAVNVERLRSGAIVPAIPYGAVYYLLSEVELQVPGHPIHVASARSGPAAQVQIDQACAGNGEYWNATAALEKIVGLAPDQPTAASLTDTGVVATGVGRGTLKGLAAQWEHAVERFTATSHRRARLAPWSRTGIRLLRFGTKVAAGTAPAPRANSAQSSRNPSEWSAARPRPPSR